MKTTLYVAKPSGDNSRSCPALRPPLPDCQYRLPGRSSWQRPSHKTPREVQELEERWTRQCSAVVGYGGDYTWVGTRASCCTLVPFGLAEYKMFVFAPRKCQTNEKVARWKISTNFGYFFSFFIVDIRAYKQTFFS